MISSEVVDLSRLQFGITALYHFLFVPLTLGLSWLLVIMEAVYVMTGKQVYKDMTQFWGKLFGINFAMGVTTGITLEDVAHIVRVVRPVRAELIAHHDAERLLDRMRDEQQREAHVVPQAQQLLLHLAACQRKAGNDPTATSISSNTARTLPGIGPR